MVGSGVGVLVGRGVFVGAGVLVGGTGVEVDVAVGTGVSVGGTGVAVGGTAVAVGSEVAVDGTAVGSGAGVAPVQAVIAKLSIRLIRINLPCSLNIPYLLSSDPADLA